MAHGAPEGPLPGRGVRASVSSVALLYAICTTWASHQRGARWGAECDSWGARGCGTPRARLGAVRRSRAW